MDISFLRVGKISAIFFVVVEYITYTFDLHLFCYLMPMICMFGLLKE
jgi:hypothetical protein